MYKINKKKLDKYVFVKHFISGIKLIGVDIPILNSKNINLNYCKFEIDNNNIIFCFNNKKRILLLNKKEIYLIKNFLKKKCYFLIPIKFLKINSFFKLKICILKRDERC